MDFEAVASEFVRALRGKRSQTALSRRLGYRSNVLYTWEAGGGFPTAARTLTVARRVGIEPRVALERFYRREPGWFRDVDPATPEGVARLLADLKGRQATVVLARAVDRDRYALGRWFKGATEPRLPDFLRMVEACSLRLVDFLASFVDLADIPALAEAGRQLDAARRVAHEAPWSHAVLRALELEGYRALPRHEPGWIAKRVGIDSRQEEQCLRLLNTAGQILWNEERWQPRSATTLDLRHDREASQRLATWCATLGAERLAGEGAGHFAYNVFSIAERDIDRLRQLQREHFGQLRAIVAESSPAERLFVANLQLFELNRDDAVASAGSRPPEAAAGSATQRPAGSSPPATGATASGGRGPDGHGC